MTAGSRHHQRGFVNVQYKPPSGTDRQNMRAKVPSDVKQAARDNREKLKQLREKALNLGQQRGLSGRPLQHFIKKYIADATSEAQKAADAEAQLAAYQNTRVVAR